jgi:SAM-dependent methyltransferase
MVKSDFSLVPRNIEELKHHYEIEKELAIKLRNSTREERSRLYSSLYDELFQRVPNHPQLQVKHSQELRTKTLQWQIGLISRFLKPESSFLEIGAGSCSLSLAVATLVRQVYALDVSFEITKDIDKPGNVDLILSDGCSINLPIHSIDVAYSNQLMEHLHPDDALDQLKNVYNVLVLGGVYICITPNRLNGPHDISRYFDTVAQGFHLKE